MVSTNFLDGKIKRLQREINQLENKRSKAVDDEASAIKKINRANDTISRSKQSSTIKTKEREIQRENNKIQNAKKKQADLLTKISKKNTEYNKAMTDLNNERQKEQNKIFKEQEKKINDYKIQQNLARDELAVQKMDEDQLKEYDVFISHSANDKDSFVNDLAEALKDANVSVWYDSDSIGWGKSIRQEIDNGLAYSKYGIVVISPSFIEKYWTNYELDGILSKEGATKSQIILPIWHNVTADQVQKYSLSLSNKLALNTGINTIDEIVENVKKLLN
ncbi:toll/interleukin-1 receptor domain-containing protein [Halobacillus sp. BAB-2008]|uniref:toll/interleukin-1 receptor domain-containing protein n=1 Tax=Halobacillus sp. BAB-2008 TaxID=1246484 RepID=UPI0002A511FB|nr:toll/interleukin-1 receptor domain-containing protein [Halobacillus sp. BAB-2008]ELK44159.1 hypothetical protein D479_20183 [Halobacillus sp. BAB-2008]